MNENKFKNGDVVVLPSGSPALTVTDVSDNLVGVIWYHEPSNEFCTDQFHESFLILHP